MQLPDARVAFVGRKRVSFQGQAQVREYVKGSKISRSATIDCGELSVPTDGASADIEGNVDDSDSSDSPWEGDTEYSANGGSSSLKFLTSVFDSSDEDVEDLETSPEDIEMSNQWQPDNNSHITWHHQNDSCEILSNTPSKPHKNSISSLATVENDFLENTVHLIDDISETKARHNEDVCDEKEPREVHPSDDISSDDTGHVHRDTMSKIFEIMTAMHRYSLNTPTELLHEPENSEFYAEIQKELVPICVCLAVRLSLPNGFFETTLSQLREECRKMLPNSREEWAVIRENGSLHAPLSSNEVAQNYSADSNIQIFPHLSGCTLPMNKPIPFSFIFSM